ncbi:hypothetical protein [Photobacterium kasasachensis]|uniref:hypothetical protein n=1 Tax=Photobacterium kasasachensis TaxID=2910240 RepID=UPI003D0C8767
MKKLMVMMTLLTATVSFSSHANEVHETFKEKAISVEQNKMYEAIKADFGQPMQVLENAVTGNTHYYHTMSKTSLTRWRSLVPVSALIEGVGTKTEGVQVEFVVNAVGQVVEVKHRDFVYKIERGIW